ncbi:mitochondrial protein [Spatholobus suberectus]|nr:mitochondrial protein [Spatholobus suberectus]
MARLDSFPNPNPNTPTSSSTATTMHISPPIPEKLHIEHAQISFRGKHFETPPLRDSPVTKFNSFMVDGRAGERWITLKRQHADEHIKLEVTMFDGAVPVPTPNGDVANSDEMQMHITVIVTISKGEDGGVLEIMCSAWPDSIEIKRLFIRANEKMLADPYAGPEFTELDDELQDRLYDFLEVRGINDDLAVFLHQYMKHKDKAEFIRWMERVKSFIERK